LGDINSVLAENIPALKAVSDPLRYSTLRRRTVVLGSIVISAFAALGTFGIWRSYVHALTITRRELGNGEAALAAQTVCSRQNIDLLLRNIASWCGDDHAGE
jgi:hypothetical protein